MNTLTRQSITAAQQRALLFAAHWGGLRCNSIEYAIQHAVQGAAFDKVADALERRGFIAGDDGLVTPAGEDYLAGLIEPPSCTCKHDTSNGAGHASACPVELAACGVRP